MSSLMRVLALILVMVCSSMVMDPPGVGIFFSMLVFLLALLLRWMKSLLEAIVAFSIVVLIILLLIPCISCAREAARRMTCSNNMKQIALALRSYAQKYQCYPPSMITDKDGRPMHSWRVLILPFIECNDLYRQYDFNEPWNGPNNKRLLILRPKIFACPSDRKAYDIGSPYTNYVGVVGRDAAMHLHEPRKLSNIDSNQKASDTVLLVETSVANVNWTEPRDFYLGSSVDSRQSNQVAMPSSRHTANDNFFHYGTCGAINVATLDGYTRSLYPGLFAGENRDKLLKVGNLREESVEPLSIKTEEPAIHWRNVIASIVWLASATFLLRQAVFGRRPRQPAAENPEGIS